MEKNLDNAALEKGLKIAKFRTICLWPAVFLFLLFVIWFVGLFKTPSFHRPVEIIADDEISQYLTNCILPEFYNKSQMGQPFEIVFTEDGVRDIVSRHLDANGLKKAGFSDVSVIFAKGRILISAKTNYRGYDFIVTAVLKPYVNGRGYFSPGLKIQAGTSDIPFAADAVKRKIIYNLAGISSDSNISDYVGMFFSDNKIIPEFSFHHRNLRIEKIILDDKKMIVGFLPE